MEKKFGTDALQYLYSNSSRNGGNHCLVAEKIDISA